MDFQHHADIIDIRNLIARVEELREIEGIEEKINDLIEDEEAKELVALREVLADLAGNGGDEQWEGDWYPLQLIADDHFTEYTTELIYDCCESDVLFRSATDSSWPYRHLKFDYEAAAEELKQDYSTIEIDGTTYWYR